MELVKALQRRGAESAPPVLLAFEVLGISDADLARAYSVSRPTVSQWRHGTWPIPRQRRIEMLAFLKIFHDGLEVAIAQHGPVTIPAGAMKKPFGTPLLRGMVAQEIKRRVLEEVLAIEVTGDIEEELFAEVERLHKDLVTRAEQWRAMGWTTVELGERPKRPESRKKRHTRP